METLNDTLKHDDKIFLGEFKDGVKRHLVFMLKDDNNQIRVYNELMGEAELAYSFDMATLNHEASNQIDDYSRQCAVIKKVIDKYNAKQVKKATSSGNIGSIGRTLYSFRIENELLSKIGALGVNKTSYINNAIREKLDKELYSNLLRTL